MSRRNAILSVMLIAMLVLIKGGSSTLVRNAAIIAILLILRDWVRQADFGRTRRCTSLIAH